MKGMSNVSKLVDAISLWNSQLPDRVTKFKTANAEANVTTVDTQPAWDEVINNPKNYGAPDATCTNSDGKSCLWYNTYHPGISIQKMVAQAVSAALNGTFF
jgi:phospholipase/lecithinase/hemolysin